MSEMVAGRLMFGLTLWRPWAWPLVHGIKRIENRSWAPRPSDLHCWVAIHAGSAWDEDGVKFCAALAPEMPTAHWDHPRGIVGVAWLSGIVRVSVDPWFTGPIGWVFERAVAFDRTIAGPGKRGLWAMGAEREEAVRAAYREAVGGRQP